MKTLMREGGKKTQREGRAGIETAFLLVVYLIMSNLVKNGGVEKKRRFWC